MGYEIADIISDHLNEIKVTSHQYNVLNHIIDCRTAFLGGHLLECSNPSCGHSENLYNSCQDRNCPKCQGSKQLEWKRDRNNDLLPVDYSHITFTNPRVLYDLYRYNKKECYSIMFRSINDTLKEFSGTSKTGFILIIHTWTQLVDYHPHIHCVLPEIKINNDNSSKISSGRYLPKREHLNITYKRILSKYMMKAIKKGKITHPGITEEIVGNSLRNSKNYIYVKRAITDSASVINYLGNFTKKIGITNERIKYYDGEDVIFTYRDRTDGNKEKEEKIKAVLFLKRFILHILPYKLTKIRYYGFMANNSKNLLLELKSSLIERNGKMKNKRNTETISKILQLIDSLKSMTKCPCCKNGNLEIKFTLSPVLSP